MRILFIQKHTGTGGSKTSLLGTLETCLRLGTVTPEVLVSEEGPFVDRCRDLEIPVHLHPMPEWRKLKERIQFASAMKHIASQLAPVRFDIILSNEMWWGPHALKLAELMNCKSGCWIRDSVAASKKASQYRLDRLDTILTVCDEMRRDLIPFLPGYSGKLETLYNPVAVPVASKDGISRLESLTKHHPDVNKWLVGVGSVGPRKNQCDTVRVLQHLIQDDERGWGCLLAGPVEGSYGTELETLVRDLGLAPRVCLTGFFDDVGALLQHSTAFVMTSKREGLPRSIIESMRFGLQAYALPLPGLDEIYGSSLHWFVPKDHSPRSLASKILDGFNRAPEVTEAVSDVQRDLAGKFDAEAHVHRFVAILTSNI
jgi:glycosyltransferase involved in cell wall biosynthesis